jgi:putative transposase
MERQQKCAKIRFCAGHLCAMAHRFMILLTIRSDNGSEFTAKAVREWLSNVGVKAFYIEPGSPWESGCNESFNGKFRDELLNCEIFETLFEAKVLIERWRKEYNTLRPHSALGFLPPAPETVDAKQTVSATLQLSV